MVNMLSSVPILPNKRTNMVNLARAGIMKTTSLSVRDLLIFFILHLELGTFVFAWDHFLP